MCDASRNSLWSTADTPPRKRLFSDGRGIRTYAYASNGSSFIMHALDSSQEACVEWMISRECDDDHGGITKGGILAEDAGFGKTRVTCELIQRNPMYPCLVVVPRAVLDSEWQATIEKVTGVFPLVVHGKGSLRYMNSIGKVVLTTHATMRTMVDAFCQRKWSRVIIDEAHLMRNPRTQLYRACKRIMSDAECKWLITATPVQNSDSDMLSLAELVGLTTHQASVVRDLIMYRVSHDSLVVDDGTISIVNIDLDAQHLDVYKHVSTLWNSDDLVKATSSIMVQVLRMRQVATHPNLVKSLLPDTQQHNYDKVPAKFVYVLEECNRLSGTKNGGGIVVFCNWIEEMNVLETFLTSQKVESWNIERLEGYTSQACRDMLFYDLKANKDKTRLVILLCQIGCAACGLNLQYAFSTVIIMRPQWNPVTEFQAVRRVVRRGQSHDVVRVSRLVASGTIDESILEMQKRKVNVINESLMDDIVGRMLALNM